jgi:hypothetical protein
MHVDYILLEVYSGRDNPRIKFTVADSAALQTSWSKHVRRRLGIHIHFSNLEPLCDMSLYLPKR